MQRYNFFIIPEHHKRSKKTPIIPHNYVFQPTYGGVSRIFIEIIPHNYIFSPPYGGVSR